MPNQWTAPKDPQAIRDYGMDWSGDIGAATIAGSSWSVVDGTVVIDQDAHTTTNTTVRLSGGTAGETCHVKNHVVLSTGEEDEYTSELSIEDR